jgi:hypothetical protein
VSDPDWIARVGAGVGVALGLANFTYARRESRWKRRNVTMEPLRASIGALVTAVEGRADRRVLEGLFTAGSGADLAVIGTEVEKVPDWRFRRWVRQFVERIKAVRGGQVDPDAALTKAQLTDLAGAESLCEKLTKRMDKAARLGSA